MLLGEKIRMLRREFDWSQQELADILNTSAQVISNWERSTNAPDHKAILELANAFDVTTDYLLGRTDIRKSIHSNELEEIDIAQFFNAHKNLYFGETPLSPELIKLYLEIMYVFTKNLDGLSKESH